MAVSVRHQILVRVVWVSLVPPVNGIWMNVQRDCTHANHQPIVLTCPVGTTANVSLATKLIVMNAMTSMNAI